jgi:hypothetical protein
VIQPKGRRAQVLNILQQSSTPLDDDQIAQAVQMNRVYVNAICRQLATAGLVIRRRGVDGKLVNVAVGGGPGSPPASEPDEPMSPGRSSGAVDTFDERFQDLISNFADYVSAFEASQAFPGPSLYFHERAIERRRQHLTVHALLEDKLFLEYVYAVLPAWGMHRMGRQKAKVGDFTTIVAALKEMTPALEELWPFRITRLSLREAHNVAVTAWDVIAHIKVSTSQTQIVAGSKFLHHLLPDLIPPIDRRNTFVFFAGYGAAPSDQPRLLSWFPQLAAIGTQCQGPISEAIERGGFMATGEAKIIDNAIMGFLQKRRSR